MYQYGGLHEYWGLSVCRSLLLSYVGCCDAWEGIVTYTNTFNPVRLEVLTTLYADYICSSSLTRML